MENPNCPDAKYPEFNPTTQECFNTATVERVYKEHQQSMPLIAPRTLTLIAVGIAIGFIISRKTR
jgi:hypothetical protein